MWCCFCYGVASSEGPLRLLLPRMTQNEETLPWNMCVLADVSPRPTAGAPPHSTPPSRIGETPFRSDTTSSSSPRDAVLRRCLRLDIKSQVPDVARVAGGPVVQRSRNHLQDSVLRSHQPGMYPAVGASTTQQQHHRHRRVGRISSTLR